jgi:hypothetical protein
MMSQLKSRSIKEIEGILSSRNADEIGVIANILKSAPIWLPLPGPQTIAYLSDADIIGFGGAAGGGKTDLAIGKALTSHRKSIIFRREATQLTGIIDRMTDVIGHKEGYNGQDKIWRNPVKNTQIEFGSMPNSGDENKYQGRPHDFIVYDEAANFLESQVRFTLGWLRSTIQDQKCQALLTFNPPTNSEGRWVVDFFAPWLDRNYPKPAEMGEKRYAASIPSYNGTSKDIWVDCADPFLLINDRICYNFDPKKYPPQEIIRPLSRTFIPSKVSDNDFLIDTGYINHLQALPEPLRSQMLNGDFWAGISDDPWQVIPSEWVDLAMDRWKPKDQKGEMTSMGIDVARGGQDDTIIARRHGMWFDEPLVYPGKSTPDGPTVAGLCVAACRNKSPMHIDVIGVGSSPYDFLRQANQHVIGVNVAESATGTDRSGRLRFFNQRTELWWKMREALDPANDTGIVLPNNKKLKADLISPKWMLKDSAMIKVESREEIVKRLGRSPDYGSAYVLALMGTIKRGETSVRRQSNWRLA